MLWSVDIVHQRAHHLTDANYMSHCGANLCYDPLVLEYLNFTTNLRKYYPPVEGPIMPKNILGYVGPYVHQVPAGSIDAIIAVTTDAGDPYCAPILSSILIDESHGHSRCLGNVLIRFDPVPKTLTTIGKVLFGNEISQVARYSSSFSWAIYGFNSGHLFSTIASHNMAFELILAANICPSGHALFKQFSKYPSICDSYADLLRVITASQITVNVHVYLIHTQRILKTDTQRSFWLAQTRVVKALQKKGV